MTTAMPAPASSSDGGGGGKRPPSPSQPRDGDNDDSYEDAFDASLFLNEEYVSVSVPVGEIEEEGEEEGEDREGGGEGGREEDRPRRQRARFSLDLLVSEAASTDFDLTGQVLWPAAALLAGYLVAGDGDGEGGGGGKGSRKSRGRSLAARSRSACELGAGLGLSGLAAMAFSGLRRLVLTDGSDVVLRVLERNARRVTKSSGAASTAEEEDEREVSVSALEWGDEAAAATLRRERSPGGRGFDLLLGADVTYSLSALPALFSTAATLLRREEEEEEEEEKEEKEQKKPVPTFLLGYVSRSGALDIAVPREAEKAGFDVEVVEGTRRRLPGGQEGWILCLTLTRKKKRKNDE